MHGSHRRAAGVVAIMVAAQLAAGIGLYAVAAHLVVHLRHDLGLLASTASLVVTGRTAVQYLLYVPAGLLADRRGAAGAGAVACLVRAAGFGLLADAVHPGRLAVATLLIGAGGAVYTPAAQALVGALPGAWPQRGFAWYTAAGQVAAVAGPALGLAVVAAAASPAAGFGDLAWLAGALWVLAAGLFLAVGRPLGAGPARPRPPFVASIVRDRPLWRFVAVTCPATLLIAQPAVAVPLVAPDRRLVTAYLAVAAAVTMLAQLPWCRRFAVRAGLLVGFGGTGAAFLVLAAIPLGAPEPGRTVALFASAVVFGAAQGLLLPALFVHGNRLAPPGALASYIAVRSFVGGVVALAGAFVTGALFDHGRTGAVGAIAALGAVGLVAAAWVPALRSGAPDPAAAPAPVPASR